MPNAKDLLDWMERKEERERNMTNEEWLHTLNTEPLAELLTDIQADGYYKTYCMNYEERLAWLKEKHNG